MTTFPDRMGSDGISGGMSDALPGPGSCADASSPSVAALRAAIPIASETILAIIRAHEKFASVADYAALTVECARCSGAGYHHGFGEHGRDPDWCAECGGVGSALNEAAYDAAEIAFITQSLAP